MKKFRLVGVLLCVSIGLSPRGLLKPQSLNGNQTGASAGLIDSAASPANDQTKTLQKIIVWRDPPNLTIPADLERSAEGLGYTLEIHDGSCRLKRSSPIVWAPDCPDEAPDIVATGHGGLICSFRRYPPDEADNAPAAVEVTESLNPLRPVQGYSPGAPHEFLFPTSPNYLAARTLALRDPGCGQRTRGPEVPSDLWPVVERIGRAYLEGPESGALYNDPDRLQTMDVMPDPGADQVWEQSGPEKAPVEDDIPGEGLTRVENPNLLRLHVRQIAPCGYWGNEHLAFVTIVSSYETKRMLGWLPVLLVLRNHNGEWRLLTAHTRPDVLTILGIKIRRLMTLIQTPGTPDDYPAPAKLLSPQDGKAPVASVGEKFGKFEWQPSESDHVVAQIVEFACNDDARLFIQFTSENHPRDNQISAGSGGIPLTPFQWRVWSVSDTGAISFSESRRSRVIPVIYRPS